MKSRLFFLLVLTGFMLMGLGLLRREQRQVRATGDDSPSECETGYKTEINENDDKAVFTAPDGYQITGVCIKSGENVFDGKKHSALITENITVLGCYVISGIGTKEVTVAEVGAEGCKDISHIDVAKQRGEKPTPTPTPTTTPTPLSTPTPTVTVTPEATPTPTLVASPTPTPTPGPTATPEPGPTATPQPGPTATPSPNNESGRGGGNVLGESSGQVLGYSATSGGFAEAIATVTGWIMMSSGTIMYARRVKKA